MTLEVLMSCLQILAQLAEADITRLYIITGVQTLVLTVVCEFLVVTCITHFRSFCLCFVSNRESLLAGVCYSDTWCYDCKPSNDICYVFVR